MILITKQEFQRKKELAEIANAKSILHTGGINIHHVNQPPKPRLNSSFTKPFTARSITRYKIL